MSIDTTSGPLPGRSSPESPVSRDERLQTTGFLVRLMRRPELGAIGGLIIVGIFFLFTANSAMFTLNGGLTIMNPSAQLGIMAVAVSLLMIGGEFDLSIGSMVAFAGLVFGIFLLEWHFPLIIAVAATLVVAALVGAINGAVVQATRLPSFIVTLAFFFILRGLSLVGLKIVTGGTTQLRGFTEATADSVFTPLFSGFAFSGLFRRLADLGLIELLPDGTPAAPGIPIAVVWFVFFTALATWCLLKTKVGNWIFASGGDARAARNSGVPVDRVKMGLFILTACSAAFVGILTVMDAGSTDAMRGLQKEFQAVIAAVIGGCLLTGGYGSALGAFFGSIIFGIVSIGLSYTTFDSDWFQVFLGVMLLIAVIFNNHLRRKVTGER
ncbi:ribose/xylose/arabinose/galactoside ABC transporter permease [Ameyamaea chiangmaiensis NBRC 103196]|uniref:Xylose transport system permease protein XylH n=1 Tax=Ameyamaea chiangmaiensis TaxID=442969 RepID=A0A850PBL4_9PROT|nr:ABC transporter permease [Ameyamaea chiangmaiensis]MBS4075027.1 ABC transporter permease [Ameyamaea chiangmaiensis]NVN40069.1 ABC transporter permease [Ameyamaea chiangmaiensis]GBQ65727.1 ribose/xylose/arabinose/galactoside ABC transporter permease [Ameyamaea chiangmaiensis NBRC 103196]